jgi:hypothetical protein
MSIQSKTNTVTKILLTRQTANTPISPLKEVEENPMINLSIEDYELICKNKMVKNMMSRTLETDVGELTELCKDINQFKEYVETKLKTIKERERAKKAPIRDLPLNLLQGLSAKTLLLLHIHIPDEILTEIGRLYQSMLTFKLRPWVPLKNLETEFLSANLNAIDFLRLSENEKYRNWYVLSANPNAVDFLSLPENIKHINYHQLSKNPSPNPKVIELLKEFIKENPNSPIINWKVLSKNPHAIEILTSPENYNNIYWKGLSGNPDPKAIDFLMRPENYNNINWFEFSCNPCDDVFLYFKKHPDKIDWFGICENTNLKAIPIIKKKALEEKRLLFADYISLPPNKIYWRKLSSNPNAIHLIITRIEDESKLSEDEYTSLGLQFKIDWDALSLNPSIFIPFKKRKGAKSAKSNIGSRLLQSNPSKAKANSAPLLHLSSKLKSNIAIDLESSLPSKNILRYGIPIEKLNWEFLVKNPNAIDLIKERIDYENSLSKEEYDSLPFKINWSALCSNPKAIDLLDANQDKIDWSVLSYNPNAIHLLEKRVKYQLSLKGKVLHDFLNSIYTGQRISWTGLAGNPSIFFPA